MGSLRARRSWDLCDRLKEDYFGVQNQLDNDRERPAFFDSSCRDVCARRLRDTKMGLAEEPREARTRASAFE